MRSTLLTREIAIGCVVVSLLTLRASAQTPSPGSVANMRVELAGDGIVRITYDLNSSDSSLVFDVHVEASTDGGTVFGVRPRAVSGDVGAGVRSGTGKRIEWRASQDVERVQLDQFRFRVIVTGASTATTKPPVAPSQPASPPVAKGGGGSAKWILIAGGVGAAAAVGVAASGGGGSSTPSNATSQSANRAPTISTATRTPNGSLIASATEATLDVVATDPDGDPITATFSTGASVPLAGGGRASTAVVFREGNVTPTVTVTDGRGGSTSFTYAAVSAVTVNGSYLSTTHPNVEFINLVQNDAVVTGGHRDGAGTMFTATGSVTNPRRLTLTVANGQVVFTLNGSDDLRTFTGMLFQARDGGITQNFAMVKR